MTDWLLHTFVKDPDRVEDQRVRGDIGSFAGIVGIVCNVILCAAKIGVGAFAGSVSIIADGVNNLSDAASNIISFFGFKLANKPADPDHPYGHGRFEYISALVVSILVLFVGVELLKASVDKLMNPEPIEFSWALVIVLVLSICMKLWMMVFNRRLSKKIDSQTLEATAVDSRNDAVATTAVLVSVLIFKFFGVDLDAWMGILVAAFIIWSGISLIRETIGPLLGGPPDPELVKYIHDKAMSYEGVLGIHDLLVHDYGPGRRFASFHAEVAAEVPILESHDVIDLIEADFRMNDNLEVSIHLDPVVTADPRIKELRDWLSSSIQREIDKRITIHDFRMVPGETHTNLIFDAVLPYDCDLDAEQMKKRISELVWAEYPNYFCVIQVDNDYAGYATASLQED